MRGRATALAGLGRAHRPQRPRDPNDIIPVPAFPSGSAGLLRGAGSPSRRDAGTIDEIGGFRKRPGQPRKCSEERVLIFVQPGGTAYMGLWCAGETHAQRLKNTGCRRSFVRFACAGADSSAAAHRCELSGNGTAGLEGRHDSNAGQPTPSRKIRSVKYTTNNAARSRHGYGMSTAITEAAKRVAEANALHDKDSRCTTALAVLIRHSPRRGRAPISSRRMSLHNWHATDRRAPPADTATLANPKSSWQAKSIVVRRATAGRDTIKQDTKPRRLFRTRSATRSTFKRFAFSRAARR